MNIRVVRDILKGSREVSLQDLSAKSRERETDMEYVLEEWEHAGKVLVIENTPFCNGGCGSCPLGNSCGSLSEKKYKWLEK